MGKGREILIDSPRRFSNRILTVGGSDSGQGTVIRMESKAKLPVNWLSGKWPPATLQMASAVDNSA